MEELSFSFCFPELERSGWAGVGEAAGRQAAAAVLDTAEEVRGQVQRAGGGQNAAAGRATQQSVNQGFTRSREERSAQFMRKSERGVPMAGRIKMSSVCVGGDCSWCFLYFRQELCEERKSSSEQAEKMRMELEVMAVELERKEKRSAKLLQEVPLSLQNLASFIELWRNKERRRLCHRWICCRGLSYRKPRSRGESQLWSNR